MLFRLASVLALSYLTGNGGTSIYETLTPAKTGIAFVHDNAKSFRRYLPESMGPGVAMLDYDSDGDMDLYFTNSGPSDFFAPKTPLRNALYRNNGDGTFKDVTLEAGVPGRDFGIGVTTCDYNNDHKPDLFLTNYGVNVLYRNNGNGTFTDVTESAGLDAKGLWTAAIFFDFDNNGTEDLFVGHFVKYSKQLERDCAQKITALLLPTDLRCMAEQLISK
ncbi:MAG: VCBS repeat-containing protein [Bryobacteraceae bacterium]